VISAGSASKELVRTWTATSVSPTSATWIENWFVTNRGPLLCHERSQGDCNACASPPDLPAPGTDGWWRRYLVTVLARLRRGNMPGGD